MEALSNFKAKHNTNNSNFIVEIYLSEDGQFLIWPIICLADLLSWNQFIEYWISSKYPYPRWTDIKLDDDSFTRTIREFTIQVSKGEILYVNRAYKFPNLYINPRSKEYDNKIGALDLETFGREDNGYGSQEVYAGGWGISGEYKS